MSRTGLRGVRTRWFSAAAVRDLGLVATLLVLTVVLSFASESFFSGRNVLNILEQSADVGIVAAAATLVVIAGGLDLSVGGIFAIGGVIFAGLAGPIGTGPALVVALTAGALVGSINAVLTNALRIESLIVTLATGIIMRGLALTITGGFLVRGDDEAFRTIGRSEIFGVKYSIVLLIAFVALLWFIQARTIVGRHIYARGGNAEAARLSGVRTIRVDMFVFCVSGVAGALAGAIVASRIGSGQADAGTGIELTAIAAVAIGGTSINGGEGAVWRTAIGVALLALVRNGFNLLGLDTQYQRVFEGLMILVATGTDALMSRIGRVRRTPPERQDTHG